MSESPSLALEFIENRGQFETGVRYAVRSRHMLTVFRDDHVRWLVYPGESNAPRVSRASPVPAPSAPPIPLALTFEGADRAASVEGLELRDAYVNFFHGSDPARWVARVPTYGRVRYPAIYPGIDIEFAKRAGALEYDVIVSPGADLSRVRLRFHGADAAFVDGAGDLVLETSIGPVRHTRPRAQEMGDDGVRREVACAFVALGANEFGFLAPDAHPGATLVIDPMVDPIGFTLPYFNYLGSSEGDLALDVAYEDGRATVTGSTRSYVASVPFPTTSGVYDEIGAGFNFDVFVSRVKHPGHELEWSTFVGGAGGGNDLHSGMGIDVDASMVVWVAGVTTGDSGVGFPTTTGAAQAFSNDAATGLDGFVFRLSADGTTLDYSTYLAGWNADYALDVKVDSSQRAHVTGYTFSTTTGMPAINFLGGALPGGTVEPTWDGGGSAGFVVRVSPDGQQFLYATFVRSGGNAMEEPSVACTALALLPDESEPTRVRVFLTGEVDATSGDIPITATAFQPSSGSNSDAFLLVLNHDATAFIYGTYLGGEANEAGLGIDVADNGYAAITGWTSTDNGTFPQKNPFQTSFGGAMDAFVTRVDPWASTAAATLVSSSWLGGDKTDIGHDVWINSSGRTVYVVGQTASLNFPAQDELLTDQGDTDGFLSVVQNGALQFSTYLGGSGRDECFALDVVDSTIIIVGRSIGSNFYTTMDALEAGTLQNFQSTNVGGSAFIYAFGGLLYPTGDLFDGPANQDGFVLRLERD